MPSHGPGLGKRKAPGAIPKVLPSAGCCPEMSEAGTARGPVGMTIRQLMTRPIRRASVLRRTGNGHAGVGEALENFGLVIYLDHSWNDRLTSSIGYSRVDISNSDGQTPNACKTASMSAETS